MSDDDREVFFENDVSSLKERIAAELRKGRPSKSFCRLLAAMMDGSTPSCSALRATATDAAGFARMEKRSVYKQFEFTLVRRQKGRPATRNDELGKAAIAATEGVRRGDLKEVKVDIAAKFDVHVRTVESAMKDQKDQSRVEEAARRFRDEIERIERDSCVSWPSGLEDEIKRKEMPE